jgi:branched-chain amino acid aminotransferase
LEGITRDSVIQIAKDNGIPFKEEDFIREDLFTADELFFCGTAANVTPIREVDNRMIGSGKFPVTRKIQQGYLDAMHGKIAKYEPWLSYANPRTIYNAPAAETA